MVGVQNSINDRESHEPSITTLPIDSYESALANGFVEAAPDAVVIVDSRGIIVLVNARTETLFGYTREQMVGQPVEFLVPLDARHHHEELRQKYVSNPHSRTLVQGPALFGRRADGTVFEVEISLNPLKTDNGTLVLSVLQDVSGRKRLEVKANHYRSVVEFSQDAIISKDLN